MLGLRQLPNPVIGKLKQPIRSTLIKDRCNLHIFRGVIKKSNDTIAKLFDLIVMYLML